MAVTRYVLAVYGTVRATGKANAPDSQLTVHRTIDHEGFKSSRLDGYNDDSELVVPILTRALEASVVESSVYRKLKLLNFVTLTVTTDPPPGLHQPARRTSVGRYENSSAVSGVRRRE